MCRESQATLQRAWATLVQAWGEARAEQERAQHEAAQLFRVKARSAETDEVQPWNVCTCIRLLSETSSAAGRPPDLCAQASCTCQIAHV